VARVHAEAGDVWLVICVGRTHAHGRYAHVNASCLQASRTALEHPVTLEQRLALEVHIAREADFDGLAVVWGLVRILPSLDCDEIADHSVPCLLFEGSKTASSLPESILRYGQSPWWSC
jgi:hypothetical protein